MKYKVIKQYTENGWIVMPGTEIAGGEEFITFLLQNGFIEEIKEKKSVYDLKIGDKYYFSNIFGDIQASTFNLDCVDLDRRLYNRMFLTYEEAEKDLKIREIRNELLKSKYKMGAGKKWVKGEKNYFFGLNNFCVVTDYCFNSFHVDDLGYFSEKCEDFLKKNKEKLEEYFKLLMS